MNVAAFEFVITQRKPDEGALIYSEFCGSARGVREGALVVNPFDNRAMAATILQALTMPRPEKHLRHKKLLRQVLGGRMRADAWTTNVLVDLEKVGSGSIVRTPPPRVPSRADVEHPNAGTRAGSCVPFAAIAGHGASDIGVQSLDAAVASARL